MRPHCYFHDREMRKRAGVSWLGGWEFWGNGELPPGYLTHPLTHSLTAYLALPPHTRKLGDGEKERQDNTHSGRTPALPREDLGDQT